jgi:hypothetical protein
MNEPVLTPSEQAAVRAYDEQSKREIEAAEHPPVRPDFLQELENALVEDSLDSIRFWQEDIGVLLAVREHWPEDPAIRDRVAFLVRMERYKIDNLREEIRNARH